MSSGSPTAKAALPSIDTREVANQTEGYVAADLVTLVEHAVRQAVIRTIASGGKSVQLTMDDFTTAINDYTPSALRGVKLAESTVAWSDIGGK
jgi:peroxin-1